MQRWLKFAKYLPSYGWTPVIYTPQNPQFEIRDESLFKDVSPSTQVFKRRIWEPFGVYRSLFGGRQKQGVVETGKGLFSRMAIWIRGNLLIPDPRKYWVKPSIRFLRGLLSTLKVDAIVTTGPPHSMHLIGLGLKRELGLPWIADFRDPWSDWDVLDLLNVSDSSRRLHKRLEYEVATNADSLLTVSPRLSRQLQETTGASRVEVITNGVDEEDFANGHPTETGTTRSEFLVTHIGLLNQGRNPSLLWQVLDELCEQDEDFANSLRIYLAGTVESTVIEDIQSHSNLKDRLTYDAYVDHGQVPAIYADSGLSLLLVNKTDNAKWIIPAKLFEYAMAGRPILAMGETQSDANDILVELTGKGFINYDDLDQLKRNVADAYERYKKDESPMTSESFSKYTRKNLASELARLLEDVSN